MFRRTVTSTTQIPINNIMLLFDAIGLPGEAADDAAEKLGPLVERLNRRGLLMAGTWLKKNGGLDAIPEYIKYLDEHKGDSGEAAFELLYSALSARQQALFYSTGTFASQSDFSKEALLAVWGGEILGESMAQGIEQDLKMVAEALIDYDEESGRCYPPESLRRHAQSLLKDSGGKNAAHRLHLQFYMDLLDQHLANGTDPADAASDIANFHHAFTWACAFAPEAVLDFALNLCQFLHADPESKTDLRKWLDNVLTVAQKQGEKWGTVGQIKSLAGWCVKLNHYKSAQEFYYRALLLHHETNSLAGQAHIFKALGDVSIKDEQPDAARDFYYKALLMYEEAHFALGQANILLDVGDLSFQAKNNKDARDSYQKALVLYESLGYEAGRANALRALGDLEGEDGNPDTYYDQAMQIYQQIDFWSEQGHILLAKGEHERAYEFYERAGDRIGMADVLRIQANLALGGNRSGKAVTLFRQALALYEEVEAATECGALYQILAQLRLDQKDPREAIRLMISAMGHLESQDNRRTLHAARRRFKDMAQNLGDDFMPLWNEITKNAKLPNWLHLPSPQLRAAITSPDALVQALDENDSSLLADLLPLTAQDRIVWLMQAIDLCAACLKEGEYPAGDIHNHRAALFKELAAVPGEDMARRLGEALIAFGEALEAESEEPLAYARTQNRRVALLRDMAGLPGEDRPARLYEALAGFDDALIRLSHEPHDYAITQLHRANLLRELAGLRDEREQRGPRMMEALEAYAEVLERLPPDSLEHATAQTNRASLLQEIATLPDEDPEARLRAALEAAIDAITLAEKQADDVLLRTARRMMTNLRNAIHSTFDEATFASWWEEFAGSSDQGKAFL